MLIKKIVKSAILNVACLIPVDHCHSIWERIRLERLRRRLNACGESVALRQGFLVVVPKKLRLGDQVSFAANVSIMGGGGCQIGDGTMIATGVTILTTTHDSSATVMRKTAEHRAVTIGKEVWIGAGAIILPGVEIGDNAIVAAGGVVTHNVNPYQVVGGVPARVLWNRSPKTES